VSGGRTYSAFVERIDERDKPPRQISTLVVHTRNVSDDEGLVFFAELQIICSTGCAPYDLVEGEPRAFSARLGHRDIPSPDLMRCAMRWIVFEVAKKPEPPFRVCFGRSVQRVVVHARWWTWDFAVISLGIKVEHGEPAFEQVDARNEGLALDAVFVQVVWVAVARSDDDGAVGHECFHQTTQDHGIGDIGALEFVEAEDLRALRDVGGDVRNGVDVVAVRHLHLVEVFVHRLHEGVEMDPCLACDIWGQRVVEEVHHHSLSRADISVHVHALWQGRRDRREGGFGFGGREEREEGLLGRLQGLDRRLLHGRLFVACEHFVQVLQVLDDI
jgi:hypothetical protein